MDIEKTKQRFDDPSFVEAPKPPQLGAVAPENIIDLDVREDLRSGKEPFSAIMTAQQSVAEGGVLRLRAIFQPVPLYAALKRFGFTPWTRKLADDDWEVWFYRGDLNAVVLDVRGLEPPEPMVKTLEALEKLPTGSALLQVNSRVPQFLLPMLEERGYRYEIVSEKPDEVTGRISRIQ